MQPGESKERLQSNRARLCRNRGRRQAEESQAGRRQERKRGEKKAANRNEWMGGDGRAGKKREGIMSEHTDRLKNGRGWRRQRE